ncbi:hypothetical protein V8B97DRAFT_2024139 [Scleroderma yunnanense]
MALPDSITHSVSTFKHYNKYLGAGWVIRQVVTLINQANSGDDLTHSEEEDCLYCNYKELLQWISSLKSDLATEQIMKQWNKGAHGAHGDDASGLKTAIIEWLMASWPTQEPALKPQYKTGHGFYHDTTAQLICPVDYNWSNPQHRASICNYHPNYPVTTDCWPYFLHRNEHYNPKNPVKGLFKNALLVKAFKHIFTSLSSANFDSVPNDTDNRAQASTLEPSQSARKNLLQFTLLSCTSWHVINDNFDYEALYYNITTFFEDCYTEREEEIDELLLWWNYSFFGCKNASTYCPQATEKKLVALTLRKWHDRVAASRSSCISVRKRTGLSQT